MKNDLVSLFNASISDGTDASAKDQPDYTTGTPWLDCDLAGNVTEATRVSLKDHFALAVNKDRILKIEIPEGYPYGGTMMDLTLKNVEDTKKKKMVAYYNAMHPWAGQDFYGRIMTGEGCADMGGMKVVLRIAAGKEGFDYDTLFRTLCLVWMEKGSLQAAYYQINDEHPMGYLRVNCTLQQFDEFINFYGIKEGDGMYLAPEDRVAIW